MNRLLITGVSMLALLAAGCQAVPRAPMEGIVASAYPMASPVMESRSAADIDWREVFIDPRLQALIEIAMVDSRDLRIAMLDAEAARAQLRVQNAGFWPQAEGRGGYDRSRTPDTTQGGGAVTSGQATASLAVTAFELDLFGRLRAESDSVFGAYLAAEAGRNAAQIVLISTVADAYLAQRAAQENLELTEATLTDWQASLRLARQLREAGQNSGLDVAQAEGQVFTAEADMEAARRALQVSENALTLAIGRPIPTDLPAGLPLDASPVVTGLPAGLPSELLELRPDIRQAENRLRAANADIRAARAAFFPRLSLTGAFGGASSELDSLFGGASRTWSFAPRITVPIFQGGRLQGSLDLAGVRAETAVATYEQTVQTAFREVADGLAGRATYEVQVGRQQAAVDAALRRLNLSDLRFRAGVDSRLELLDAQRQLYTQRQTMVSLKQARYSSAVALYRAVGGGLSQAERDRAVASSDPSS